MGLRAGPDRGRPGGRFVLRIGTLRGIRSGEGTDLDDTRHPERLRRGRLLVIAALCAGAAAGIAVLYRADPTTAGFYPRCMFHELTGLHCPGCGTTRALHRLVHGDVAGAFGLNALAMLALPVCGYWLVRNALAWAGWNVLPPLPRPRWMGWAVLMAVIAFGVLRNLPQEPFAWLAP